MDKLFNLITFGRINKLKKESDSTSEINLKLINLLEHRDMANQVCCCGSNMEDHGWGDNHSPVCEWDYAVSCLLEDLPKLKVDVLDNLICKEPF